MPFNSYKLQHTVQAVYSKGLHTACGSYLHGSCQSNGLQQLDTHLKALSVCRSSSASL